tara:strand:- start:70 stop:258 length:189 start_codon:yes stop_codon:yes gene_type:complete
MTHGTHRSDESKGVGTVIDHTITESGEVNFYTMKWADGSIEKDVPKEAIKDEVIQEHGITKH